MKIDEALIYVEDSPDKANSDIMEIVGWQSRKTPNSIRWSKDNEKTLWRTPNIVGRYDLFLEYCIEWMADNNLLSSYIEISVGYQWAKWAKHCKLWAEDKVANLADFDPCNVAIFAPMNIRVALFLVAFGDKSKFEEVA